MLQKNMNNRKYEITCESCGKQNTFDQPYAYHAGFSNDGFLYNEAGNLTLVWSTFDPFFEELFPAKHPWSLDKELRNKFERILPLSPNGDRWLFDNPARCCECAEIISEPMLTNIYYLVYSGSVDCTDINANGLQSYTSAA